QSSKSRPIEDGLRSVAQPKPPDPGVNISIIEPAGAANAPLLGSDRVMPSGVVSVTTAAAPALPPRKPNGGEVIRSMHSAPVASAPSNIRQTRLAPHPPRQRPAPPESGFTSYRSTRTGKAISSTSTGVFIVLEMPLAMQLMPSLFGRAPNPPLIVS